MRASLKASVFVVITAVLVGGLVLSVRRDRGSEPYVVSRAALSGWTIVSGQPDDPWIMAAHPPATFSGSLFRQLSERIRRPLLSAARPDLPLVLRSEYADALQGVWAGDELVRAARNAEIEAASFEPVCVAHKVRNDGTGMSEFFFVLMKSSVFERLRDDLQPDFPEHAGTVLYDPRALPPIVPLATTDRTFDRWWPLAVDPLTDCQAQLIVE